MGQSEIQKILEREISDYISTLKIASILNQTTSVVTRALNQMFKYREVSRTKIKGVYYWKLKEYYEIKTNLVIAK